MASALTATASTAADDAATWAVSPAGIDGRDARSWIQTTGEPGGFVSEHLAVTNLSASPASFALSAADGRYTARGRFTMLEEGETSTGAGTWISLPPTVDVSAGATVVVPFTISVPANATPGDHSAGVAASLTIPSSDAGSALAVQGRVGFRVTIRVPGELRPSIAVSSVEGFYTDEWNPFRPGRLSLSYIVANTGNTLVEVSDSFAPDAASRGRLLPGDSRRVSVDAVDAWPMMLVERPLTVTGHIPDSELGDVTSTATVSVVAAPWPQAAALIVLGLLLAAGIAARRRQRSRLERLLAHARAEGRASAR